MLSRFTPSARNTLGNIGWLLADKIVRMGLGLLVGVWIARYLGPARFGKLNFSLSFVALFGTLTTVGLEGLVVRQLLVESERSNDILGTAFAIRACGSIVASILAVAAIWLMEPSDLMTVLMVGVLSIGMLFGPFDTIDSYFQSQVKSRLTVWSKNAAFLVVVGLRAIFILVQAPIWAFAAAQSAELMLGALGLAIAYTAAGFRMSSWQFSRVRAIQLLSQSWPVILSGMAIMVYMRIDMVMLKLMVGDSAVGIYATAARISEVWYFVPTAIVSSVAPSIIRAIDNQHIYYFRIQALLSAMTVLALSIGGVIALGSKWLVHILYSDAYASAAPVLAVHIWASVFVFLGVAQAPWDLSQNLLKLGFYRTLAGAISNVLLNLILIPKYSAMGAAIATVVSYAISAVFANVLSSRTRPIFYLQLRSFYLKGLWTAVRAGAASRY